MIKIFISLSPSLLFLYCLQMLDSFKLVKLKTVGLLFLFGCISALTAYLINVNLLSNIKMEVHQYSRFIAPIVEEIFKAVFIIYFVVRRRIAFLVEAAIYGFSIGAGFAFLENIYYLNNLGESNLLIWILRGFGTAIMHGCTTAIFSILLKYYAEKFSRIIFSAIPILLIMPIVIHGVFNSFLISPIAFTVVQLTITPLLFYAVFIYSEKQIKNWLELSLESNHELLADINDGKLLESKVGFYLHNLQNKFSSLILADIVCYIRLYVELSMLAKGLLLMKEIGLCNLMINDLKEKIDEVNYLEKRIGFTGKMAIQPIIYNEKGIDWIKNMLLDSQ